MSSIDFEQKLPALRKQLIKSLVRDFPNLSVPAFKKLKQQFLNNNKASIINTYNTMMLMKPDMTSDKKLTVKAVNAKKNEHAKELDVSNQHIKNIMGFHDDIFQQPVIKVKNIGADDVYKVVIFGVFKMKKQGNEFTVKEAIDNFETTRKDLNNDVKSQIEFNKKHFANALHESSSSFHEKKLIKIYAEISAVKIKKMKINKIPMKNAYTLHRDWLKYSDGIDKSSYEDMKGRCVYTLLIERLKPYWKNVDANKLYYFFKSWLETMPEQYLEGAPFFGEFTMDSGVNTDMIQELCESKKIPMYAFDYNDNCFYKKAYPGSNYRPIVYYLMDGHMYMITDQHVIKSLSSAQKTEKNIIVSSMLEMDKKETPDDRNYIECSSFEEAMNKKDSIVYLNQQNITEEVYKYISDTNTVPKLKVSNYEFIQFENKVFNTTIICDKNVADGYTWKDIKYICEKADIPFKNQKIGSLISDLKKKFYKPDRRVLTTDEKAILVKQQFNKCTICVKKFQSEQFQYDHIKPLCAGGSNDIENFQALCSGCHLNKTMDERNNSEFIKFDEIASTFNSETLKVIQSNSSKQWAFIERLDTTSSQNKHKIDHTKCRRNILLHSKYDYPRYSVMDRIQPFDNLEIKVGCYFIETTNYFPYRGNGWYPYVQIIKGLEKGIISNDDIKYQFLSSFVIKHDYFKTFAEYMIDLTKDAKLDKLIVNSFAGCLGIQRSEFDSVHMTLDKNTAGSELTREGVFVSSHKINNTTSLYSIFETLKIVKDDMYLPIYNQIIAIESFELFDLEQMIISKSGYPLERNTDAILYEGDKIDINNYFWDEDKTANKYRYEEPATHLRVEKVCQFVRTELYQPSESNWNEYQEIDDFDLLAQQIFDSQEGCQINGVAGAGKTTLANKLINLIEFNGKKCIKLAPTRKAASHIGGQTIHKHCLSTKLSNNYEKKLVKNLKNIDYVIVDEISMMAEKFYRYLVLLKRYVPKLIFVLIGDHSQLKPVNDPFQGDYKNSPALFDLCDSNRISLEKCRRSDVQLFNLYNGVRNGNNNVDVSKFPVKELTKLNIAYTHHTRIKINKQCMDKFVGRKHFVKCKKIESNYKTQDATIFEGMPIVSYKNDDKLNLYNSQMFKVHAVDKQNDSFTIINNNESVIYGDGTQSRDFCYIDNVVYANLLTLNGGQ